MLKELQLPIYLDYMATTPADPRVIEKMLGCLDKKGNFGNPASKTHAYGWRAHEAVQMARQHVADFIHADDSASIVWTSGATEAINLALKGTAHFYQRQGRHIITFKTEHKAVLDTCHYLERQGFSVSYLNVKPNGLIDLETLAAAIREDTILVSVLHVNNEIGVIQAIKAMGKLTRSKGVLLHVDGAQSPGKAAIDVNDCYVDLLSLSAHKVYGPKGIGALYVRPKPRIHLEPLIHGGGHERGLRSGTLATHQIVGMGEAFRIAKQAFQKESEKILKLRQRLWDGVQPLGGVHLNGDEKHRAPGNLNISFEGIEGETLIMALKDLAISTGSACTSALIEPSHVLQAIGVNPTLAHSSFRFSIGRFTTQKEIDYAIKVICEVVHRLRK